MTDEQFKALQNTFPWTEKVTPTGLGGLVQVIDKNGEEVPIFVMTAFLTLITKKLTPKEKPNEQARS